MGASLILTTNIVDTAPTDIRVLGVAADVVNKVPTANTFSGIGTFHRNL
jgi:hypothetical protein